MSSSYYSAYTYFEDLSPGSIDGSCRDDIVVESGDAAPESCLPSLEMRSSIAAGGLVPTGEASTATETTSNETLLRF